jgi:hypothetical protein
MTPFSSSKESGMEGARLKISGDIARSFRKNLNEDPIFMCLYSGQTGGGIVTNERPFTGQELISLFSSVIEATEEFMLPAIMYSLLNLYGPIKVFDVVKDYSQRVDREGPFKVDPGPGSGVPPMPDN